MVDKNGREASAATASTPAVTATGMGRRMNRETPPTNREPSERTIGDSPRSGPRDMTIIPTAGVTRRAISIERATASAYVVAIGGKNVPNVPGAK